MKSLTVALILIGSFFSTPSKAQTDDVDSTPKKKYLMGAMGDSISAGFLADTYLTWFNPSTQSKLMSRTLTTNLEQNLVKPENLASTIGMGFVHLLESRYRDSWTTGKKITSHYELLKASIHGVDPKAKVSAYNVAISGGTTEDLITEANQLVKKMSKGKYDALKYVTLLIGANDVCTGVSADEMMANLHQVFSILNQIKQNEPIRILMSSIPRIPDVAAPSIRAEHTVFGLTCQELRKIDHSCPLMATWATQQDYDSQVQKIQATNELLERAADDANKEFSNLNIVFSDTAYNLTISGTDLAIDCFHPNADTQNRLSQELWGDQPWYK